MKKILSFLLALAIIFSAVPVSGFTEFSLKNIFSLPAITAKAATVIVITTGDANPSDMDTWLDIDSDRVEWSCSSSSVRSYRYTIRQLDDKGNETDNFLVERELTTNKYFNLSSLYELDGASLYKIWVGGYTDRNGENGVQGDPGCIAYFRTIPTAPTVSTGKASGIGDTYATISATLEKNGGKPVTEHGFIIGTSSSSLTFDKGIVYPLESAGDNKGSFTTLVTGLSPSTKYYYKYYATNEMGTSYCRAISFTTKDKAIECPHETYDVDKFNISSQLEYEQYNDSQHYSVWYYNWDCTVCGARFKEHVTDDANRSLENHSYPSGSNICECCGYTNNATYTVTYNAKGGTGAPASQTKQYNVALKLSTVIPSKKGYTFLGWSTSATATSATYSAGGNYTQNSNCTLYAVWSSAVSKVIIDGTEIAPEYLRNEQTGIYAELYRLTSALNGSYTQNGNNATVRIYNENYGDYFRLFYTLPSSVSEGSTFNVEVYNETTADKFLTHGVYADGMIYGNVDLLARIGNMKHSADYNAKTNCKYVKADALSSGLADKKSSVSFAIADPLDDSKSIPGSTTISFEQCWLVNDSINYNHGLAQFCSQFSMIGYSDCYGKAVNVNSKTQLKTALESVGFKLVDINMQTGRDEVNYFIATRQGMDLKTGEVYDVIFVGLIGSYKDQWYSDFDPWGIDRENGASNELKKYIHQGFFDAETYVFDKLEDYMKNKYDNNYKTHNIKIILTGHSRGAAAANLLGKSLINGEYYTCKNSVFTYAFATPRSVIDSNATSDTYSRLFNIVNPEDFVTKVMPEKWGFERYGTTLVLPSKTNDDAYDSYLKAMNVKYAILKKGEEYKPYDNGEVQTYKVVQKFNSFNINEFYYGFDLEYIDKILQNKMNDREYEHIPYYFLKFSLCAYLAKDKNLSDLLGTGASSILTNDDSTLSYIFNYFVIYKNEFAMSHQMETYCAYMLSMTEKQLNLPEGKERKSLSVSADCPVDVDIYDKQTGELVGRIRNNVIDETIAAKENSVVMTVDGDSKSFWLPSNGDYKVVLTGNDEGTMDYIVRSVDSDTGETERINYFDVEVVKGVSMNSEFGSDNSTIDDFKLKDESGTEIAPTEKLYEDGFNTVEIKVSADGDGFVTNSHNATRGDYVTVSATPNTVNLFLGWYTEQGVLVTQNKDYSFVAKENVSLVAKFTKVESFIVSKQPNKLQYYYKIDNNIDLTGIELEVTYSDGTKKTV